MPPPDSILWEEGDETPVWLQTNLEAAELRVDGVSLGLGGWNRRSEDGEGHALGRGEGCLDLAVTGLEVYGLIDAAGDNKTISVQGTLDRGGTTGDVDVFLRIYAEGADPSAAQDLTAGAFTTVPERGAVFKVVAAASHFTNAVYTIPAVSGRWVIEASHDQRFPATARVHTAGDLAVTPTVATWPPAVGEAFDVRIPNLVGVVLIACREASDVAVTLHDETGAELYRYLVDVHADPDVPTPQAAPANVTNPDVRVCVDSADARANLLDGWEYVGAPLTAAGFGLTDALVSVTLGDVNGHDFVYFFAAEVVPTGVQLRVTPAGAGNTAGLDAERVYPIEVTAASATATGSQTIGVWLDLSRLSPGDDGHCS